MTGEDYDFRREPAKYGAIHEKMRPISKTLAEQRTSLGPFRIAREAGS